jgi:trans-aconitate methyltransferase
MTSTPSDWNASDYAKNSSAQLVWAQELIEKLALQGTETLLDIGCGDGKISARLAEILKHGQVLGVDASPAMIQLAARQFPPQTFPNLSFVEMDAADLHLPRRFDVAFSNATLHWVKDQSAVLRGVHACLNPRGRLLFQLGGRGNADDVMAVITRLITQPHWAPYFTDFTPPYNFCGDQEYSSWLRAARFRPLRVELIQKDMTHPNPAGLLGWLRTTWFPYTDRLPVDLREPFLAQVVENYLHAHPLDVLGQTHVGMVRLEVEAESLE